MIRIFISLSCFVSQPIGSASAKTTKNYGHRFENRQAESKACKIEQLFLRYKRFLRIQALLSAINSGDFSSLER